MSTLRGGRGASRARGGPTFGAIGSGAGAGAGAATTTTKTMENGTGNNSNHSSNTRTPRPGFNTYSSRGRASNQLRLNGSTRGRGAKPPQPTARGGHAARGRGSISATFSAPRTEGAVPSPRTGDAASYQDRFQALKKKRERERADAIARGFLADPDKPRTLAEAITPVGTCPDMCAEFERIERVVQKDVWNAEMEPGSEDNAPAEHLMVKKFRRAAAGLDEQLPSDLRPPAVLKNTVDYLFNDVVGNAESLGAVHHFVWDRTRAIRNDFSIQQMTKLPDVEIAIDCYERIARFHILSLHQLALPEKPYDKYDWYQEREQLDRTLLSLMQYYDDIKGRLVCPNESEFRAYLVIFQAQDPTPDLEERVNAWEPHVTMSPRVRKALDLYSAACNVLDPQGPLKPRAVHPVAQEDWNHFFTLVQSNAISYLMACVSEIYFNLVRRTTLNAIWRAFRPQSSKHDVIDFTLDLTTDLLGFDDDDQTVHFCQQYGFVFKENETGTSFLDLKSVQGTTFPAAAQGMPHQTFSQRLVESKRAGRTFPAIINGFSVLDAQTQGMVDESVQDDSMMAEEAEDQELEDDDDSLFVGRDPEQTSQPVFTPFMNNGTGLAPSPFTNPTTAKTSTAPSWSPAPLASKSPFAAPTGQSAARQGTASPFGGQSAFGQPSAVTSETSAAKNPSASNPFAIGQPSAIGTGSFASLPKPSVFGQQPVPPTNGPKNETQTAPRFDFTKSDATAATAKIDTTHSVPEVVAPTPAAGASSSALTFSTPFTSQPGKSATASPFSTGPNVPQAGQQSSVFNSSASTSVPTGTTFKFASTPPVGAIGSAPSFFNSAPANATTTTPSVFAPPTIGPAIETRNAGKEPTLINTPVKPPPSHITSLDQSDQSHGPTKSSPDFLQPVTSSVPVETQHPAASISASSHAQQTASSLSIAPAQPMAPIAPPKSPSFPPPKSAVPYAAQPNQPKKPSPLSQSFSATDDSRNVRQHRTSQDPSPTGETTPLEDPLRKAQPLLSHPSIAPTSTVVKSSPISLPSKDDMLQKVAREATLDIDTGFLRQFIEFTARQAILETYDQLYMESLHQLADNFRAETLASRYGRRWREICWRRNLVRRGRERRKRVKKDQSAKELEKKLADETCAVDTFLKSVQNKKSANARASPGGQSSRNRTDSMNAVHQSVAGVTSLGDELSRTASTTHKNNEAKARDNAGQLDIFPKSQTGLPPDSTPARSSYLSFSTNGTPGSSSVQNKSTRSSYFRLRALGIDPNGGATTTPLARKRAREDSEEAASERTSISPRKSRTPPYSTQKGSLVDLGSHVSSAPRRSLSIDRPRSKAEEDDEALFARARAARQALSDSAAWYRSEIQLDESQQRQEMARSLDTPSMQRAREAARLRASQNGLGFRGSIADSAPSPRVPAYRFRESKFVPRERYGKPVLKASEKSEAQPSTSAQAKFMSRSHHHVSPSVTRGSRLSSEKQLPVGGSAYYSVPTTEMPDGTQPYFSAPAGQDNIQGLPLSGNHTTGDSTVAEALYQSMMQPGQDESFIQQPKGSTDTNTFIDPAGLNGAGDGGFLPGPGMQGWANHDNGPSQGGFGDAEDSSEEDEEGEEEYWDKAEEGGLGHYDDEEELFDDEEEEEEEEEEDEDLEDEDEEDFDDDDEEDAMSVEPALNGQLSGASAIKAGTGTQDDAFELSD